MLHRSICYYKTKMMHDKKSDLYKNKEEVKQLVEEEIVSRYYYQKGRLEATLDGDTVIKRALVLFKDMNAFNALLNPPSKN